MAVQAATERQQWRVVLSVTLVAVAPHRAPGARRRGVARHATERVREAVVASRAADVCCYSMMVTCDAMTSKGLNSPVRPCASVAVTV